MELKSKFAVGKYVCEMSYKPDEGRLDAEWLPCSRPRCSNIAARMIRRRLRSCCRSAADGANPSLRKVDYLQDFR
jgi:hypothetical protein